MRNIQYSNMSTWRGCGWTYYFSLLDRGGSNLFDAERRRDDDATTRRAFEIDVTKRKRKSERDRDRESKRLKTDRRMLSIEPQENSNTKFLFESSIKASNHQASVKRFNNTLSFI